MDNWRDHISDSPELDKDVVVEAKDFNGNVYVTAAQLHKISPETFQWEGKNGNIIENVLYWQDFPEQK